MLESFLGLVPMKVTIRRLGNSQGVIIPKPILQQVGLETEAEMVVEKGAIVLRKPTSGARAGWAEASRALAESGDDALAWPEFGNDADKDLRW
jgi:antitoxin MazE